MSRRVVQNQLNVLKKTEESNNFAILQLEHVLSFTDEKGFNVEIDAIDGEAPSDYKIRVWTWHDSGVIGGSGKKEFPLRDIPLVANYLSRRGDLDRLYMEKIEDYSSAIAEAFKTLIVAFRNQPDDQVDDTSADGAGVLRPDPAPEL